MELGVVGLLLATVVQIQPADFAPTQPRGHRQPAGVPPGPLLQQHVEAVGLPVAAPQDVADFGGLLLVVVELVELVVVLVIGLGVDLDVLPPGLDAAYQVTGAARLGGAVGQGPDIGQQCDTLELPAQAEQVLVLVLMVLDGE